MWLIPVPLFIATGGSVYSTNSRGGETQRLVNIGERKEGSNGGMRRLLTTMYTTVSLSTEKSRLFWEGNRGTFMFSPFLRIIWFIWVCILYTVVSHHTHKQRNSPFVWKKTKRIKVLHPKWIEQAMYIACAAWLNKREARFSHRY